MLTEMALVDVPQGTDYKADAAKAFWSNVKWYTLFCLIETEGSQPITVLARKSGLSVEEAVNALEAMEAIGFIEKSSGSYKQTNSEIRRYNTPKTRAHVISDYVLTNNQISNCMLETVQDEAHITRSVVYNSKKEYVTELYANIAKAIDDFKEKSDASKETWDGVYALSMALIAMTRETK